MNFLYEKIGLNIPILCEKMNSVVVEHKQIFSQMVFELWRQYNGLEGRFIFSDADKRVNLPKETVCIINPFDLSLNNKKIINQIYRELQIIGTDAFSELRGKLLKNVIEYLDTLVTSSQYPLTYNLDMDDIGLYKLFHLEFENNTTDLLELITEYVKMSHVVCNINLFIFVNLKSYITEEQYQLLYDTLKYEEVYILNICNSHEFSNTNEKSYIIDKDLCIIEMD